MVSDGDMVRLKCSSKTMFVVEINKSRLCKIWSLPIDIGKKPQLIESVHEDALELFESYVRLAPGLKSGDLVRIKNDIMTPTMVVLIPPTANEPRFEVSMAWVDTDGSIVKVTAPVCAVERVQDEEKHEVDDV